MVSHNFYSDQYINNTTVEMYAIKKRSNDNEKIRLSVISPSTKRVVALQSNNILLYITNADLLNECVYFLFFTYTNKTFTCSGEGEASSIFRWGVVWWGGVIY